MKFSIAYLAIFTLLFSACTKNADELVTPQATITEETLLQMEVTEENFDQWIEQYLELSDREITVEHATLEEINAVMVAHGLEPFTEDEMALAHERSGTWNCGAWDFLGDYNNSGTVSTLDIVLAQQYLCNSSAGCTGSLSTNGLPSAPRRFSFLSYINCLGESNLLNSNDMESARDYILGIITCF